MALGDVYDNMVGGPDVPAADAAGGNQSGSIALTLSVESGAAENCRVWLDPAADPATSFDSAGLVRPTNEADAVQIPTITPGNPVHLHIYRTIPPGSPSTPKQLVHILVAFDQPL